MVDQLCQCYSWSFQDVMKLTLRQIVLLNHAAHVNSERMKARTGAGSTAAAQPDKKVFMGKSLEQMSSVDMSLYYKELNG